MAHALADIRVSSVYVRVQLQEAEFERERSLLGQKHAKLKQMEVGALAWWAARTVFFLSLCSA